MNKVGNDVPSLPPKPMSPTPSYMSPDQTGYLMMNNRSMNMNTDLPSGSTYQTETAPDLTYAPFPILRKGEIDSDLNGIMVELPSYMQELTLTHLEHFIANNNLIKSYLLTDPKFAHIAETLTRKLEEQIQFAKELKKDYETNVLSEIQPLNTSLSKNKILLDEWNKLQVTMYDTARLFQKEGILSILQHLTSESDANCTRIAEEFVNHQYSDDPQRHILDTDSSSDEPRIKEFLKSYRKERKQYYMRHEILDRFKEDRIGGIL
ncbi:unnamed protein product [[Candida] boidinii]|nr:hypothetical protein BVG19_g7 [[Candida] boidinii]OWB52293.1 hypothetical protein B5S27_g3866 [[Candida] boidinii]GMF10890.1 unnamed protein product [[Candida] boidinii]